MTEPSVFISYSHEDRDVAREIASALRAAGMKVWIDKGELHVGDSLIERIAVAIQDANYLIALVSSNSIQSNWCQKEISLAITGGIYGGRVKVLPVRVGRVVMPPTLADLFYLDFDANDVDRSCAQLIEDIRRQFQPLPSSERLEFPRDELTLQINSGTTGGTSHSAGRNLEEVAVQLESGLLSRMDQTNEAAVIVSLVPSGSGQLLIDSQKLAELRLDLSSRRVIPCSPHVDWLNIGVGPRRYTLDGGIGTDGTKFCAAELHTDGNGVFAFMIRPSSGSADSGTFIFNDEAVVAAVLGGLWLLGEYAIKRAESSGPYLIRARLVCAEDHQALQPGLSRNFLTGNTWKGTRALESALGVVEQADGDSILEPSPRLIAVAHRLLSELFQSFGMAECPQLDQSGRVRIKYWGEEWASELVAWANKHGIEISEETIAS